MIGSGLITSTIMIRNWVNLVVKESKITIRRRRREILKIMSKNKIKYKICLLFSSFKMKFFFKSVIAQWIRLHPPSYTDLSSNLKHSIYTCLNLYFNCYVKKEKNKQKEAGIGPYFENSLFFSCFKIKK